MCDCTLIITVIGIIAGLVIATNFIIPYKIIGDKIKNLEKELDFNKANTNYIIAQAFYQKKDFNKAIMYMGKAKALYKKINKINLSDHCVEMQNKFKEKINFDFNWDFLDEDYKIK